MGWLEHLLSGGLASLFSLFTGRLQFLITRRENLFVAALQFVFGGHESDLAVQAHLVVVRHELACDAPGVIERQRRSRSDAFGLERLVPALDLAVALRVMGRGPQLSPREVVHQGPSGHYDVPLF